MALSYDILRQKERQIEVLSEKLAKTEKECYRLRKENAEFRKKYALAGGFNEKSAGGSDCDDKNCKKMQTLKSENEELKRHIEELKNADEKMRSESMAGNKIKSSGTVTLRLPCAEKNLFENEIEDYLYDILYLGLEEEQANFPANKCDEHFRKLDIIEALLKNRTFDWEKSETFRRLHSINTVLDDANLEKLQNYGFTKRKNKNYPKYCFFKERYQLTFSSTPRDSNASKQQMREIRKRCFLVSGNRCAKIAK